MKVRFIMRPVHLVRTTYGLNKKGLFLMRKQEPLPFACLIPSARPAFLRNMPTKRSAVLGLGFLCGNCRRL